MKSNGGAYDPYYREDYRANYYPPRDEVTDARNERANSLYPPY